MQTEIDLTQDLSILNILLADRTSGKNVIWATNDYTALGPDYMADKEITPELLFINNEKVVKPRKDKMLSQQDSRTRERAEVFTPSLVCNAQNNLVDDAWFQKKVKRFNSETDKSWKTNYHKISFSQNPGKTWQDYVRANRLEVSCGEAPYLTSRYDTVTGNMIPVKSRVGLLDRKLRVIGENTDDSKNWLDWAKIALQSTYGFEWQGDNVCLARQNMLMTTVEHYCHKFQTSPEEALLLQFAEIISWNIWQMDGIKFVIPNSCRSVTEFEQSFFDIKTTVKPCPGCESGDCFRHNGIYATIMDWEENKVIRFVDLVGGGKRNGTI